MNTNDFGTYTLEGWHARLLKLAQAMPANWFGKRLALVCRKLVLKNGPDIIDSTIDRIHFRLHMRDNVSERKFLFLPQFFDVDERRLLNQELSNDSIFVDIGANAGIYTLTAAATGATVLAIEPNPEVLERLHYNLTANGLSKQVTTLQKGVVNAKGAFELKLDPRNLGGSSLVASHSGPSVTIECDLLENLLIDAGITRIDILKIDIEGAEDQALIPFFQHAPAKLYPDWIIIENSAAQWQHDLPAMFQSKGYQLVKRTRMNSIWRLSAQASLL